MHPRILPLSDSDAPTSARPILEATDRALGMVPNLHRTLAHSPAALRAYAEMAKALGGGRLPARLREQIALATAGANACTYCASAHTALGRGAGLDDDELERGLEGKSEDPKSAAALTFVGALVERLGAVRDEDLAAVRAAGFTDAEIVEITAHVALNTYTNMFNLLARTEVDFPVVALAGRN